MGSVLPWDKHLATFTLRSHHKDLSPRLDLNTGHEESRQRFPISGATEGMETWEGIDGGGCLSFCEDIVCAMCLELCTVYSDAKAPNRARTPPWV